MMSVKENYLRALRHEKTDRIPMETEETIYCGFGSFAAASEMETGPFGGGLDWFGVEWVAPESGGGNPLPAPGKFLLEDICDWREVVKFPDVDAYHWAEDAAANFEGFDREKMVVLYGDGNGCFDRLNVLMGFENALIALVTEPEECAAFFDALIDYKIKRLDKIVEHFHPDVICVYDDVATQMNPFMSPAVYRALISPRHKRLADEIKKRGIIPILHCCGRAEDLIEDFIDEGFACWSSVQPVNDIPALLEKYGDRIALAGGYDSNGKPGSTADVEIIRKEIVRCCESYGYHNGYIFFGFSLLPECECNSPEEVWAPTGIVSEEFVKYATENAKKYRG